MECALPKPRNMTSKHISVDVTSTAAAAKLLFDLRMRHNAELPFVAWQMLANAESRLNRSLEEYFRGTPTPAVGGPTTVSADRHLKAV